MLPNNRDACTGLARAKDGGKEKLRDRATAAYTHVFTGIVADQSGVVFGSM